MAQLGMNFDVNSMAMYNSFDSNPYVFSFNLNQMGFQGQNGAQIAQMNNLNAGYNVQQALAANMANMQGLTPAMVQMMNSN